MGTNYYHRTRICECCGRYDETHICKNLVSFNGVVRWLDDPPYFAPTVTSWGAWKARILDGGEVWDEYGEHIPAADFIERVEKQPTDARRRQYDWLINHGHPTVPFENAAEGIDWLDPDGFSFHGGEFS